MGEHADMEINRMLDGRWVDGGWEDDFWTSEPYRPLPPGIRAPELKPASPEDFPLV